MGAIKRALGGVEVAERILSTYMGHTYPHHSSNSCYRSPTFYHIGTWDSLGSVVRPLYRNSIRVLNMNPNILGAGGVFRVLGVRLF